MSVSESPKAANFPHGPCGNLLKCSRGSIGATSLFFFLQRRNHITPRVGSCSEGPGFITYMP